MKVINIIKTNIDISLDEIRYETILYFILSNCYKFTRNGLINIELSIKNSFLQTIITDNGIGIEKSKLLKIFQIYGNINDN